MHKRRAKIIGTLGPSTSSVDAIVKMIKAGLNVARINLSHGTHKDQEQLVKNVREAEKIVKREVAILADLQGPKIRLDVLDKALNLKAGDNWFMGTSRKSKRHKANYIPVAYDDLIDDCHVGARVLFDDGKICASIVEKHDDILKIKVIDGGELASRKGINLPDCNVSAPSMTDKDKDDLFFIIKHNIDFIALSFVRSRDDVYQLKSLLHKYKINIPIIAKIERPQAVDNLGDILKIADLILIARGDMGVEMGNHNIPSIQKNIIKKCNEKFVPVITATQMLESMNNNLIPTRAEASDVANAIWDGSDAVMLSSETASGKYPIESLTMMDKIIYQAEKTPKERPLLRNMDLSDVNFSVGAGASMVAEKIGAKKILAVTESGNSCLRISQFRPKVDILGVTNNVETSRRICMYWGITPYRLDSHDEDNFNFQTDVLDKVKREFNLKNGDKLVFTRGDGKFFANRTSHSVKVEIVKNVSNSQRDTVTEQSDSKKTIIHDASICASCRNCISICPHDIWAVTKDDKKATFIDKDKINACSLDMECIRVCPTGAIEIIAKE